MSAATLRRLSDEEYAALWDKDQTRKRRVTKNLGRMTDEEYIAMWNGGRQRTKIHVVDASF